MTKLLNKLDSSSAAGISELPSSLLKHSSHVIAPFLTKLFNDCVANNQFPDEFKSAIVVPLYKGKGSAEDMNNYRGISILPPIAKLFEKILAEQLKIYFEINKLFFHSQHGFRSNHSCESALHEIISMSVANMDNNLVNLLLFVDFKKAFDLVDSRLLLAKLGNYGINNQAIELIKNYFLNRQQKVKIGNFDSEFVDITLGAPQGSVLGPLIFLIFINDLPMYLNNTISKLFADDTTMLFSGDNIDLCINKCKKAIELLIIWCNHNRLMINWKKTQIMFVTKKRVSIPKVISLQVNSQIETIDVVDKFKLLGVTLDNKLNFINFVTTLSSSVNSKLFAIKRLFYLNNSVKLLFFLISTLLFP